MCYVEHNVFLFTELEVLLAKVGAAGTRLKQRLDLIYGNRSDDDRDTGTIRSNIGHAAAMAPIDTTAHLPGPTQVQEPVMDAQCTS